MSGLTVALAAATTYTLKITSFNADKEEGLKWDTIGNHTV
jgi:hypothetical protein